MYFNGTINKLLAKTNCGKTSNFKIKDNLINNKIYKSQIKEFFTHKFNH